MATCPTGTVYVSEGGSAYVAEDEARYTVGDAAWPVIRLGTTVRCPYCKMPGEYCTICGGTGWLSGSRIVGCEE